jgi:hypothetical protein
MDAIIILGFFFGLQPLILYIIANYSIEISKVESKKEEWK